jgi:thiol-disulfide isomerase/thioredoxin
MTRLWLVLLVAGVLASCSGRSTQSATAGDPDAPSGDQAKISDTLDSVARPGNGPVLVHKVEVPPVQPVDGPQLLEVVRDSKAKAVLVNVWATWCVPCRQEFPDLMQLQRNYRDRGLEVVLVSADFDDQMPEVRKFLASHLVDFPTYMKTGDDMKFIDALTPRWTGALPATFVYDGDGNLRAFHEGKETYDTFEKDVLAILKLTPNPTQENPS